MKIFDGPNKETLIVNALNQASFEVEMEFSANSLFDAVYLEAYHEHMGERLFLTEAHLLHSGSAIHHTRLNPKLERVP